MTAPYRMCTRSSLTEAHFERAHGIAQRRCGSQCHYVKFASRIFWKCACAGACEVPAKAVYAGVYTSLPCSVPQMYFKHSSL